MGQSATDNVRRESSEVSLAKRVTTELARPLDRAPFWNEIKVEQKPGLSERKNLEGRADTSMKVGQGFPDGKISGESSINAEPLDAKSSSEQVPPDKSDYKGVAKELLVAGIEVLRKTFSTCVIISGWLLKKSGGLLHMVGRQMEGMGHSIGQSRDNTLARDA